MANQTIYSKRVIRLTEAGDSSYRQGVDFISDSREITGSNTSALKLDLSLSSGQAALTISMNDIKAARVLFLDCDSSVKVVLNSSASLVVGRTSVAGTVGRPCILLEGSITALSVLNRLPSSATSVRIRGYGTTI